MALVCRPRSATLILTAGLAAALVSGLVSGCSSSGAARPPSSAPAPVSSSATSRPAASPTSPAPSPASSPPLSGFEADPGVRALRAFARTAAQTVNTGHYISPALRALLTPAVAAEMKQTQGTDVGLYYPGPVPFTPIRVEVSSPTGRKIAACFVSTGFAQNPRTHRPAKKLKIIPVTAQTQLVKGRWLISGLLGDSFSCAGVKVPMPRW